MRFGKARRPSGAVTVVMVDGDRVVPLNVAKDPTVRCLADLLHAPDPVGLAHTLIDPALPTESAAAVQFLAPVDRQEIWAAGVTYKRSKIARQEESVGAAQFYDKVYTAPRPELFLKATPERVAGPGDPIRVRRDSTWSVPEPEFALVVGPDLRIVGYTVGNDVSARDIEGENPLYLPQAKIYAGSCAVGPVVTPAGGLPPLPEVEIHLVIRRDGAVAYQGTTNLGMMARTPEDLVDWLGRENEFPNGVILLTGTGIVPPDEFTLRPGDDVEITITGVGTLSNRVA